MNSKKSEQYSAEEAERRATDALRRALTTPYKPQREMVGKAGRTTKAKPTGERSRKTSPK